MFDSAPVSWSRPSRAVGVVPDTPGLWVQAVHSLDVGDAFCRAVARKIGGAFNIAAEPVLTTGRLVLALEATPLWMPRRLLRGADDAVGAADDAVGATTE